MNSSVYIGEMREQNALYLPWVKKRFSFFEQRKSSGDEGLPSDAPEGIKYLLNLKSLLANQNVLVSNVSFRQTLYEYLKKIQELT
ncbi:MAG: hypothetical protein DSM106950_33520 [Stigonema ocellatum SAG 48.90 = DSM 106950]|nr:hypothetical protein [Stigonema ocellatum SAG 48.90 = DSM 106950]